MKIKKKGKKVIECKQNLAFHFEKGRNKNRRQQHKPLEDICSRTNDISDNQVECIINSLSDYNGSVSSLNLKKVAVSIHSCKICLRINYVSYIYYNYFT